MGGYIWIFIPLTALSIPIIAIILGHKANSRKEMLELELQKEMLELELKREDKKIKLLEEENKKYDNIIFKDK